MFEVGFSAWAPVAPADALAWWLDFREGAGDHAFLGLRVRRRILARSADATTMEDRAPLFRERVTARREGDAVVFEGVNTFSRFRGSYAFSSECGGTRIALRATIRLRGLWRVGEPIARPLARRLLRLDLEGHARELAAST
ncbi:MAG: hypothetical protein QOE90_307 [Thermoplasmata archaeon]|nr:hypothetical protein [Thermoplasmata archaeon]